MASSKAESYRPSMLPRKLQRSISPSVKFCSSTISSSSSNFASSMSNLSSPIRSSSPNRISIHRSYNSASISKSFQFSMTVIDRSNGSPGRSVGSSSSRERNQSGNHGNSNKACSNGQKKTCMCSPTTHPGSFRCSLHKNVSARNGNHSESNSDSSYHSHRLYARRSAMTNSLVRIGTVEGDLVKRALASLIRPSSHQQRRRCDFQPRPSQLSVMSKAGD